MQQRPAPAPKIVVEELDGEVCLYRPDTDEVLVLNRTASEIWRLADGANSAASIAETLAGKYAMELGEVRGEVTRVLTDLSERGFLVDSSVGFGADSSVGFGP